MRPLVFAFLFVALIGCGQQPPPPAPNKGGINITAPGVNITVDPQGGANIQAPGVNVQADPKGGAKVNAPGVNVQADPKGAKVDVNPNGEK
jgi:hypothetical protein